MQQAELETLRNLGVLFLRICAYVQTIFVWIAL